jgi:hypothetical protein
MNEQFSQSTETKGFKDSLRETKDKIKTSTKEVASQAKERGEQYANQTRQRAAERINRVSERVKEAADHFEHDDQDPDIARYTRILADKLESTAAYVRDRDFQQLRHEVEDVARRHPALFFGGMFVAGIAAARFLKASADRESSYEQTSEEIENRANAPYQTQPAATI